MNSQIKLFQQIIAESSSTPESEGSLALNVTQRLTTRFWSRTLIDKKSFEGAISDGVRRWLRIDRAESRIQSIFCEAMRTFDPQQAGLTKAEQDRFYQLKYAHSVPEACDPLRRLQAALRVREPICAAEEVHWSKDVEKLKQLSLLRNVEEESDIDATLLDAIFCFSSRGENEESLDRLLHFIKKDLPAPMSACLQKAVQEEKRLQTIVASGPSGKPALEQVAADMVEEIQRLSMGQKRVVFAKIHGRPPHFNITTGRATFFSQVQDLLLQGNATNLVKDLTAKLLIACRGQNPFSAEMQEQLKVVMKNGIVAYMLPELTQSLFTNRSLGAKILLAPIELLRIGVEKGAHSLCEWLTNDLSEQLISLLGKGGFEELYNAAMKGTLEAALQEKIESHLGKALQRVQKGFQDDFSKLTDCLPPYVSHLIRLMDFGDLGEKEQPFLFEIQKQNHGRFTLSVFAGGAAAYLQPSQMRDGRAAYQVLVAYADLTSEQLDVEFFNTLFSYRALPEWGDPSVCTTSDLYNGLLESLAAQPTSLSNRLEAYSSHAAENIGQWGALYAYIHHNLGLKTVQEEENFLYELRKRALLSAACSKSAPSMRSNLKQAAEAFLDSAAARFEAGGKTDGDLLEMQKIYATVWEILGSVQDSQKSQGQKRVILPVEIETHLQTLLSSVPSDLIETVKDLLIGAAGKEIEEAIDSVVSEMPARPPVVRTFSQKATSLVDTALKITLGVALKDFTQPTFWSYVRLALMVARVALFIFFPSSALIIPSIGAVASIGLKVLKKTAVYFFPETIRALYRAKNRFLGRWFAKVLLNDAQLSHFHAVVGHWHAMATRSGLLSYDLSSDVSVPPVWKLHPYLPQGPMAMVKVADKGNGLSLTPRKEITQANVGEQIDEWLTKIAPAKNDEASEFLNDRVKSLPVPQPGDQDDFWTQAEDVRGLLERMGALMFALYQSTAHSKHLSVRRRAEVKVSLFKAYAIIDKLAHRCPEARLNGFTANGWYLATWNKESLFRLYGGESRVQLKAIQEYFGVDPDQDAYLSYDSEKIQQAERCCLFIDCHRKATDRYLKQFLDDPTVIESLAAHGITQDAPMVDKVKTLYADPSLIPNEDRGNNPRKGIMPRPFHLLHMAHLLANELADDFVLKSHNDPLIDITDRDNHVRKILHTVTFGHAFQEKGASKLDTIPLARYVDHTAKVTENERRDLWDQEPNWRPEQRALQYFDPNLPKIVNNFLHLPPREQNEIVNDIPSFRELRKKSGGLIFDIFDEIHSEIFKPKQFNNPLAALPPTERKVIEMIRSSPAAHTLAYFSQHIDRLCDTEYLLLFRVLLLQGDVLYPYLQTHPEFTQSLGSFFKRAIDFYTEARDWATLLNVIEIGIFARASAEAANPGSGHHFPSMRDQILQIRQYILGAVKKQATLLLPLPHLFIDPRTALPEQVKEAVHDIALSLASLHKPDQYPLELFNDFEELLWNWKSIVETALNGDQGLRNSVLNAVASDLGWIEPGGNSYEWDGLFPHFTSGPFQLALDGYSKGDSQPVSESEVIQDALRHIFDEIPFVYPLHKGVYPIHSHNMGIELRQLSGERGHRLAVFKMHKGEKFYWNESEGKAGPFTYWMGERRRDGTANLLILDKKGTIQEMRRVRAHERGSLFEILPQQIQIQGEACEEVDLSKEQHGLALLSWFQPLSSVRAYRSVADPTKLRRIEFSALKLSFNIEGGKAVGMGAMSGLIISLKQQIPPLRNYARYLLLENSNGTHLVALPSDTLRSAAISWMLKRTTSIETPLLGDRLLDSFLDQLYPAPSIAGYYLYDMNEKGHLTSSDPEAVLHLLAYHLAQDSMADVRRDLVCLENLGKRKCFSEDFLSLSLKLQLAVLGMNHPEITRVILRLAAICEENKLVQPNDQRPSSREQSLLSWIALQGNYYHHLTARQRNAHLDEYQELFILNAIAENARNMIATGNMDFQHLVERIGLDLFAEVALIHPRIADRYHFLRQKYALKEERESIGFQTVLRSLILGRVGSGVVQGENPGQSIVCNLVSSGLDKKKALREINFGVLSAPNPSISWEDIPLNASQITEDDWMQYMPLYYRLAVGELPQEADRTLFQKKRETLRKTLYLLKGKKSSVPAIDPWIELLRLAFSHSRWGVRFPSPEEFTAWLIRFKQMGPLTQEESQELEFVQYALATRLQKVCTLAVAASVIRNVDLLGDIAKKFAPSAIGAGIVSYVGSYVSVLTPIVPLTVGGYFVGQALLRERRRLQQAHQEREDLDTGPLPDGPLSEAHSQFISEEDTVLSESCSSLIDDHFDLEDREENPGRIDPFDAESNDLLMQKCFGRLNQSLTDFYEKGTQIQSLYRLKNIDHFYQMGANLREMRKSLATLIDQLKADLIGFSRNTAREGQSENVTMTELVETMRQGPRWIEDEVYFQELVQAFGGNDETFFSEQTTLSADRTSEFEQKMYRFLLHATRLHQIERAIKMWEEAKKLDFESTEAEILFKQLSFEMCRKRAYDFKAPSTRLFKGFLLFEYATRAMLWDKQVKQIQKMLLGSDKRAVLELLTGLGKTFFGLPMIAYFGSDHAQSIYNFFPDSLASSNIEQISQTSQLLGQAANAVEITRSKPLQKRNLWAFMQAHERALHQGEHFNGRKKDLQALELHFLEAVYNHSKGEALDNTSLLYYMQLLKHIREKVRGNVDEAHHLFRRNEELNYPMGIKKRVEDRFVAVITECARHWVASEAIAAPSIIHTEYYHAQIKVKLAEKMSAWQELALPEEQRPLLSEYLCGNVKKVPDFVEKHSKRSEIGLIVGILNKILPDALQRKIFVDYGPSKAGHGEYARPYSGNDCPIETSTIKNPFEAVLKTSLMLLHTKLNQQQLNTFALKLRELAKAERKKKGGIPLEATQIARSFALWTKGYCLAQFTEADPNWDQIATAVNDSPSAILAYGKHCVIPDITYFSKNLRSDSQNFASMFSSFYSDTATPNRDGIFPLNTKVLWDEGTTGEFVDFICRNCDEPGSTVTIDSLTPQFSLTEILEKLFKQKDAKTAALIDAGALFRGLSNAHVAQTMVDFCKENRPDIRGIVFFNEKQELVIWEIGSDRPIPLSQSPIKPEHRLTYLDQIHMFGSDVKQGIGATGVVTLNEASTLEEFVQAGGRMRGLKSAHQRLIVVVNQAVKQLISGDENVSMRKIVIFTQKNEAAIQSHENYLSARQKIDDIVRRAILDEMIFAPSEKEMVKVFKKYENILITESDEDPFELYGHPEEWISPSQALHAYKKAQFKLLDPLVYGPKKRKSIWEDLLPIGLEGYLEACRKVNEAACRLEMADPLRTYRSGAWIPPDQALDAYKKIMIQTNASVAAPDIKRLLDSIRIEDTLYPRAVPIAVVKTGGASDLNVAQEVEQNQDQAQEIHQEQNQQLQQDIQVDTQLPASQQEIRLRQAPAKWEEIDYFADAGWVRAIKFESPASHLDQHSKVVLYTVAGSHKQLFSAFKERMFWTNNFLGIIEGMNVMGNKRGVCEPLSHLQKPILELLVIQEKRPDGSIITVSGAIDQADSKMWRKRFEENRQVQIKNPNLKIALFDPQLQTVLETGKNALSNDELFANPHFRLDLIRWKFLAGHTNLQTKEDPSRDLQLLNTCKRWLTAYGLNEMKNLFLTIYKQHGHEKYAGSDMEWLLLKEETL